jgi:hypothetical protein
MIVSKIVNLEGGYAGWQVNDNGVSVTFVSTTLGVRADSTYSAGVTGATGGITMLQKGVADQLGSGNVTITLDGVEYEVPVDETDTIADVAFKIRTLEGGYDGWEVSGQNNVVIFASETRQARETLLYNQGQTFATGEVEVDTEGVNDTVVSAGDAYLFEDSKPIRVVQDAGFMKLPLTTGRKTVGLTPTLIYANEAPLPGRTQVLVKVLTGTEIDVGDENVEAGSDWPIAKGDFMSFPIMPGKAVEIYAVALQETEVAVMEQ